MHCFEDRRTDLDEKTFSFTCLFLPPAGAGHRDHASILIRWLAVHCDRFTRHSICYSAYMSRQFRLSVCPSVTRVYCIKTAECIIDILSTIILVFRHQGLLRKSDGFIPTGAPNTGGVAIFDQYAAISR